MAEVYPTTMIHHPYQLVHRFLYFALIILQMFCKIEHLWEAYPGINLLLFPFTKCEPFELNYQHSRQPK